LESLCANKILMFVKTCNLVWPKTKNTFRNERGEILWQDLKTNKTQETCYHRYFRDPTRKLPKKQQSWSQSL